MTKSRENRFNSRAREGRDKREYGIYYDTAVSIHAPVRGATPDPHDSYITKPFQFTRP